MRLHKLDLYAAHRSDYVAAGTPLLVTIGPAQYLSISGACAPAAPEFRAKIAALYNVAFTIKMAQKRAGRDYAVSKLEALWWGKPPQTWRWRLLIRTPEFIGKTDLRAALAALREKGNAGAFSEVRLERVQEGRCIQMLHVGPYEEEKRTVEAMRRHARSRQLRFYGRHHEIYLSDPRRVPPERLRTILRQPVG